MRILQIFFLILLIFLSGCIRYPIQEAPSQSYYLNPAKNINPIGRVALIEMANHSSVHHISESVTESLYQEIQKEQIFSLIRIPPDNDTWRVLQLQTDDNYTLEQVALMRKTLKCDALLAGTITVYEPYPHLMLGLRLRLIDLSDGQLIWAIEQVWDTTDKSTRNRIEAYYTPKRLMLKEENLSGQLGSVSSLKFFKFVAHEISQTLPKS